MSCHHFNDDSLFKFSIINDYPSLLHLSSRSLIALCLRTLSCYISSDFVFAGSVHLAICSACAACQIPAFQGLLSCVKCCCWLESQRKWVSDCTCCYGHPCAWARALTPTVTVNADKLPQPNAKSFAGLEIFFQHPHFISRLLWRQK